MSVAADQVGNVWTMSFRRRRDDPLAPILKRHGIARN